MSFTYVMGENSVTLFNLTNGNKITVFEDDARYDQFKNLIQNGLYEDAEKLDIKAVVQKFGLASTTGNFGVVINDGVGVVQFAGQEYPLADVIVKRILRMESEGFSALPLVNFLENLHNNPSKTAIDELFLFLDATDLPITIDGCFIAYKIVKSDFKDIYTGNIDNSVGLTVAMPRFAVDDVRSNTCSAGLHFCSKDYLAHYGSSNRADDKCVLVKINPADVVSIPSDYHNAKGRTCKYEVVGVMNDSDWRQVLSNRDYNEKCVVNESGDDWSDDDDDSENSSTTDDTYPYHFDTEMKRWRDVNSGKLVSRDVIMREMGWTFQDCIDWESNE